MLYILTGLATVKFMSLEQDKANWYLDTEILLPSTVLVRSDFNNTVIPIWFFYNAHLFG